MESQNMLIPDLDLITFVRLLHAISSTNHSLTLIKISIGVLSQNSLPPPTEYPTREIHEFQLFSTSCTTTMQQIFYQYVSTAIQILVKIVSENSLASPTKYPGKRIQEFQILRFHLPLASITHEAFYNHVKTSIKTRRKFLSKDSLPSQKVQRF